MNVQKVSMEVNTVYPALDSYRDRSMAGYRFFLDGNTNIGEMEDPRLEAEIAALERHLEHETPYFKSKSQRHLRGTFLQWVTEEALDRIAQQAGIGTFSVEPAPMDIFDDSTKEYKGGDLLLIQKYSDGQERIIALIDATTHKSSGKLRSGMFKAEYKGQVMIVPTIILGMEGLHWRDRRSGKDMETQWYLHTTVRQNVRDNRRGEILYGLDPKALPSTLDTVRQRFSMGTQMTKGCIEGKRYRQQGLKESLLAQLQLAEEVLGIKQE